MIDVISRCQAGEREAQKLLYDEHHQRVFRLAIRMVGRQDADDVLQQVFLQTFRGIRQFSGRASFATWLYRLTINECLQFRRRERRATCEMLADDPADNARPCAVDDEQQELLEKALARLDPELRALFLLREVDRLSYAEIAKALAIPAGTAGSRLNRARRQLREHLKRLGWEP